MAKRKTLGQLGDEARGEGGIACPRCGCRHFWRVRDTDNIEGAVRRYRKCRNCGRVVRTKEVPG
jgi:DNA-directed RNA polymerase subunit RPC12/RpoP